MKVLYFGTDFPHEKGKFCNRAIFSHYVLCCFSTPFSYEVNQELLCGNPGELLLTPPGSVVYHGPQEKDEAFVNDWIHVGGDDFHALLEKYPLPENKSFSIGNPNFLKNQLEKLRDEHLLKRAGYEEMINCCLTETVIEMNRLYERHHQSHSPMFRIESAREIFLRHPEKDWSLQDMAQLGGYSVSRFCALYCQRFGCSPKAELLANRMELAKQLLHYSELSITEISERCGFKSIYYFSKYFKETVGMTPSDYAAQFTQHRG